MQYLKNGYGRKNKLSASMISMLCGIVLFVCMIAHNYLPATYVSACAFIYYAFNKIVIQRSKLFLKYIYLITMPISYLIGVLICDTTQIWLGEIRETTFFSGAFCPLAFYFWVFFVVLDFFDGRFCNACKGGKVKIKLGGSDVRSLVYKHSKSILFIMGSVMFLTVARHPSFMLRSINRFTYAQQYVPRFLNVIRPLPVLFSVILIYRLLDKRKISIRDVWKEIVVPFIPYILFLIWIGNKFGAFWDIICAVVVPLSSRIIIKSETLKKIFKWGIGGVVILYGILVGYYIINGNNTNMAVYLVSDRIAVQGELWWKIFAILDNRAYHIADFIKETSYIWNSIITEGGSKEYGIYHLMKLAGNPAVVEYYQTLNTRFSASGIELPFYFFRYWSFIIMPLFYCPIFAWLTNVCINACRKQFFVTAMCSYRLIQLFVSAMAQGDWYMFATGSSEVFIALFLIALVIRHRYSQNVGFANSRKANVAGRQMMRGACYYDQQQ